MKLYGVSPDFIGETSESFLILPVIDVAFAETQLLFVEKMNFQYDFSVQFLAFLTVILFLCERE